MISEARSIEELSKKFAKATEKVLELQWHIDNHVQPQVRSGKPVQELQCSFCRKLLGVELQ